ncbi:MAG: MFS transporter [Planctomycetes bacterium]|nr:MFS transporter [Planctomycetota bacterium]
MARLPDSPTIVQRRPGSGRLPFYSRYTYHYHLRAELLNHLFLGVFGLYEAVARKALHASPFQITLLSTLSAAVNLLGVFWSVAMRGRPKAPFFLLAALLGRGALLLVFFVHDPSVFVLLAFCVFMADPIFTPAQNSLLQANYPDGLRGRLYGEVSAWAKILFLGASLGAGFILDRWPDAWRPLFAGAALAGIAGYCLYSVVRIRALPSAAGAPRPVIAPPSRNPLRLLRDAVRDFLRILREHPTFGTYERNYFVYGLAFMIQLPVGVLLLVDHFRLDYAEFSLARQVLFMGTVALASPLGGRLLERYQTIRASGIFFTALAAYPLTLLLAWELESTALVYLGYALFGLAMAGVGASWSLGAIYFARGRDSSDFMGVHVTCVGVRGLIGPYLGYALYEVFGFAAAYGVAAALFLLAGFLMFRLARAEDRRRAALPAGAAAVAAP